MFLINSDVNAQQVRGRSTDAGVLYYYTSTGRIVVAHADIVFDEEFLASTLNTAYWDTVGNSASGAVVSFPDTTGGVMTVTTGGADNDDFEIGTDNQLYLASNPIGFEATIRIDDVSGTSFFVGFADSGSYASADSIAFGVSTTTVVKAGGVSNAVGFVYDPDATTDYVYGINANAGTSGSLQSATVTANNTTPTDFSVVTLRCEIDRNQKAEFFVNGKTLGTTTSAVASTAKLHLYSGNGS